MHRVKRYAQELITRYENLFDDDFSHNKQKLEEVASFMSKELRNEVAGYITSMVKRRQKGTSSLSQEAVSLRARAVE